MNFKKTVSFLAAASLLPSVLYGCSSSNINTDETSSAPAETSSSDAKISELPNDADTQIQTTVTLNLPTESEIEFKDLGSGIIANIGGTDITEDEFRYYFNYAKKYIDNGDETYWNGEETEEKLQDLKEQTLKFLFSNSVIYRIAEENSVVLDDADNAEINKQYQQDKIYFNAVNSSDENAFDNYLKETYCTEEVYKRSYIRKFLERKTISSLYENDFREKYFNDHICTKYIQIDDNKYEAGKPFYEIIDGLEYTDEELETIENLNYYAEEDDQDSFDYILYELTNVIVYRLYDGESFDSLMKKYSKADPAPEKADGSSAGYYLSPDSMPEEFSETALYLEEEEYTEEAVYADGYGYFLIEREPFDEEYLSDYLMNLYMSDKNYPYSEQYEKLFDDTQKKMKVILDDNFNSITLTSLFE